MAPSTVRFAKPIPTLLLLVLCTSCALSQHLESLIKTNIRQPTKGHPTRILCWILSLDTPKNNEKSRAVADTWAPRCDKFLIIKNGSVTSEMGNTLTIPVDHESRDELWHKVSKTFIHIHDKYLNQFDWFMKADDDTYVVVNNLRKFLSQQNPNDPVHFGHRFKKYVKQGYMSGGSGYVLSREALKRLVRTGFKKNLPNCNLEDGKVEDVVMGSCLEAVSVKAGDSRDEHGLERFFPLAPEYLFDKNIKRKVPWYTEFNYYTDKETAISKELTAFHYMNPERMRWTDFLLNELR